MWWSWWLASAGACELGSVVAQLDAAEAAFLARDEAALDSAVAAADRSLRCVREVVPSAICARLHFAHALAAWGEDESRCAASLRAAIHAEPFFRPPEAVVPPGHALRALLARAEETAPDLVTGAPGARIDGLRVAAIPQGQPYVWQPIADDGPGGARRVVPGGADRRAGGALRWAGVGTGAVAFGLLGAAASQRAAYFDAIDAGAVDRWQPLHDRTNALSIGWTVTGLAAAALFTTSFAVD